jgi:hypothetical protein
MNTFGGSKCKLEFLVDNIRVKKESKRDPKL